MARTKSPVPEGSKPMEATEVSRRRNSHNVKDKDNDKTDSSRSSSASPPSPTHRSVVPSNGQLSGKKKILEEKHDDMKEIVKTGSGYPVITPPIPALPCYTWEEVAKHNTPDSCWCYIGTKVYDITSWLDRHPGGRQVGMQ